MTSSHQRINWDNNGMNAEPPIARFQMGHQPRRPGYARRSASREPRMGKRDRYRDHVDPEYRRWGRTYRSFPGVDECVRLILDRRATGAWADIIAYELAENASERLDELLNAFRVHESNDVALYVLTALEMAALPASVDFLAGVLRKGNPAFRPYAQRALQAIDTKESRTALFHATDAEQ
ncbi:hypothetical protein [Alienimonas sp. DA493]|uniref:hypothetical protein n=1 Tax=Alienimonas sp. DA493 TaxID=3373605 RepID=UPI003754B9FA